MPGRALESPPEELDPMQTIIFHQDTSPTRNPVSPSKGKGLNGRTALGELTPRTTAARGQAKEHAGSRSGSSAPKTVPAKTSYPRLSPDKVGRHFTFELDNGHQFVALDARFVLWYHCRTKLHFESIATAYNATYPQAHTFMLGSDAEAIVERIKSRWKHIKQDLDPGHFPPPDSPGWHPCDHLMTCNSTEGEEKKSVLRGSKDRVAGIKLIREILTTMWQGSWDELVQCPRGHSIAADNQNQVLSGVVANRSTERNPSSSRQSGALSDISAEDQNDSEDDTASISSATQQQIERAVELIGGPKVLYHFIKVTLRIVLFCWLLSDWFTPLYFNDAEWNGPTIALRASALDWKSFVLMIYGALKMLESALKVLKHQVLIFDGIDREPPIGGLKEVGCSIVGIIAALLVSVWKGWDVNVGNMVIWSQEIQKGWTGGISATP